MPFITGFRCVAKVVIGFKEQHIQLADLQFTPNDRDIVDHVRVPARCHSPRHHASESKKERRI